MGPNSTSKMEICKKWSGVEQEYRCYSVLFVKTIPPEALFQELEIST